MSIPARAQSETLPNLVRRVRDGSTEALGVLYDEFGGQLFALAYRLMGTREDAEDVVHDVFVGLPEALMQYEERGRFDAWLRRIAARLALARLRSRRRRSATHLRVVDQNEDAMPLTADQIALQSAIDALPDSLRSVLLLKEVEGYSHAEIADLLGVTAVGSRVRLFRALRRLRRELAED